MKPLLALVITVSVAGCGQSDPPDGEAGGGSGAGGAPTGDAAIPNAAAYFPLVAGATWTYAHLELATGAEWDEIVSATAVDFEGRSTIKMQDNENLVGEAGESLHVREGTQVVRIHKDVTANGAPAYSVDYTPGFLRWDDAWAAGRDTPEWVYTRRETDTLGVQNTAVRNFSFTVLSTSTEVTVPAGTFDCVHVERVRQDTLETKQYWFADGVGKVRELNVGTGNTEVLVDYQVD